MKSFRVLTAAALLLAMLALCGCKGEQAAAPPIVSEEPSSAAVTIEPEPQAAPPSAVSELTEPAAEPPLTIAPADYPKVDGSTATIPLGEAIAAVLTGQERAYCRDYAAFSGTDNAWRNLVYGYVDLVVAYEPSAESLREAAAQAGYTNDVTARAYKTKAIGSDALVFLVNRANPVDNLTMAQVQSVYEGKITNWAELGGEDADITAYQRNETAGSQVMFKKLAMSGLEIMKPPANFIVDGMMGLLTAVADFNGGRYSIGYNVYYYVTEMTNNENIKILSIDGVYPSKETIESGAYRLVNNFCAAVGVDEPEDSPAGKIFDWLGGEEAARLIEKEGYCKPLAD